MSKLAVVTGGTKGIGRAIVEKFASHKFDVVACSRNTSELDDLKKDIEAAHGVRAFVYTADLSVASEARGFAASVNSLGFPVEVLVNNAGSFVPGKIIDEKEGVLESVIEGNLYSAYHVTRGLLSSLLKSKSPHIFNMCSIASLMAYPNGGAYTISKFALLGFSKSLREELKQSSVRVTAILPGATLTSSWEGTDYPDQRFMKAEDVADAVFGAFSLSPQSVVEEIIIRPQLGDI